MPSSRRRTGRARRRWRRAGAGGGRSAPRAGSRGTAAPWSRSTSRRRPCPRRGRRRCRPPRSGGSPTRRSAGPRTSISWRRRSRPRGVSRRSPSRRAVGHRHERYGDLTERSRTLAVPRRRQPRETSRSQRFRTLPGPWATYVVRVWLPDRPGALGQVASRIGAVRGDVVGIDILERGAGRAIDELVVELPDDDLAAAAGRRDRPGRRRRRRGRPPGRRRAATTPGSTPSRPRPCSSAPSSTDELLDALCVHGARTVGAEWAVVVDSDAVRDPRRRPARRRARRGSPPSSPAAGRRPRSPASTPAPTTSCGRRCPAPGSPWCSGEEGRRSGPGSGARPRPSPASSTPGFASSHCRRPHVRTRPPPRR